ncbi:MAG: peptidoglycan LD-endopeptidase LytH [Acidimicrobiaceae bacterium]|jgi:murein DD-endopeptidase MepM/ murein hydrolase activator NlpD
MARIRTTGVAAFAVIAVFGALAPRGSAQEAPTITLPGVTATTPPPTTAPGDASTTTPPDDSSTTTTVDVSQDGDNGSPTGGGAGQVIPSDAQAIIDGLVRSGANEDHLLVAGEKALLSAGVDPDQAARLAYGRFPVAGPAAWVDDWYAPRFTGETFRFHLGLDLIAAYGTPLRSPADGIARIDNNSLGGLAVKVVQPDGTFFYLAHMSATAEGLVDGAKVVVGDLLGYVGQSGDATGPHCHFGIYLGGTTPIPPKPLIDQWVADQGAQLPAIIASITGTTPRSLLATGIVRQLTEDGVRAAETPGGPSRTELLFATSASPSGGALQIAQASAAQAAGVVDWVQRASLDAAFKRAWDQAVARAWVVLDPLTPLALRPT